FFFQAEDGIRDLYVTGVQTCALPIYLENQLLADVEDRVGRRYGIERIGGIGGQRDGGPGQLTREVESIASARNAYRGAGRVDVRSEERRVGKECRSRGWEGR